MTLKPPRYVPRSIVLLLCAALSLLGCQAMKSPLAGMKNPFSGFTAMTMKPLQSMRSQSPDDESEDEDGDYSEADEFDTVVETPLVGEYTTITGLNVIRLQGVGLITGLKNTGGDPPPSIYRTALLEEMRRRGVSNPNQILSSPTTALVVVRAYLPPLIRKGDPFDVQVSLPDNSTATSLAGGWLMETNLSEHAVVPGRGVLKGHIYARAEGSVLISVGAESEVESREGLLRKGRILAGGTSFKERDLALFLRNDYRSVRNSKRIADRIGARFHHYTEYGAREPLCEAKTDQKIVLKVHPKYRDNFPRYLQVIRSIAFRETPIAQRVRLQLLEKELNESAEVERTSLALEAIGREAIPVLKRGLHNKNLEVRFHSAVALAYLGEPDGLDALQEAARTEPAFRVYAFAAMAALDEAESHVKLRELMSEASSETRYGAFRALSTLDPNDPFIRGALLNDQYQFHVLDTQGPPMVHLTRNRKTEIVLFDSDQEFRTPLFFRAGDSILVRGTPGSDTITVTRFSVDEGDDRRVVSTRVADVILAAAELGATYPEVAQMLMQAGYQENLPGPVEVDALPKAGRVYYRPSEKSSGRGRSSRVGSRNQAPNLFGVDNPEDDEDDARTSRKKQKGLEFEDDNAPENSESEGTSEQDFSRDDEEDADRGTASLSDIRSGRARASAADKAAREKKSADLDAAEDADGSSSPAQEARRKPRFDPLKFFRREKTPGGSEQTEPGEDDES